MASLGDGHCENTSLIQSTNKVNREYQAKDPMLRTYLAKVQSLSREFKEFIIDHVERKMLGTTFCLIWPPSNLKANTNLYLGGISQAKL